MKRSEIRGMLYGLLGFTAVPGFRLRSTRATKKENIGGETPTDAKLLCRGFGHGCAWIARRSSIGVPPRLWLRRPNATTQLQFRATREEAAVGFSP